MNKILLDITIYISLIIIWVNHVWNYITKRDYRLACKTRGMVNNEIPGTPEYDKELWEDCIKCDVPLVIGSIDYGCPCCGKSERELKTKKIKE